MPLSENATVDQKMTSLRCVVGMNEARVSGVADPNRAHTTALNATSATVGNHMPIEPRLCSHLLMFNPMTLSTTASPSPRMDAMTKYDRLSASVCPCAPRRNSAFAAEK